MTRHPPQPPGSIAKAKGGKPAADIPDLGRKLEFLLQKIGRPNKWLTQVVVANTGTRPSAQMIANWKNASRVPVEYLVSLRAAFGLEEGVLEESDYESFEARARDAIQPGSGQYWKTLLQRADTSPSGLALEIEGVSESEFAARAARMGNISFERPIRRPPPMLQVPMNAGLRFTIKDELLRDVSGGGAPSLVACCEDRLGWKTICPDPRHAGFVQEETRWKLPSTTHNPLYFDGMMGRHSAVVIAFEGPAPHAIHEGLLADNTVWATDALAAHLFMEDIAHIVLRRDFLVIAASRTL